MAERVEGYRGYLMVLAEGRLDPRLIGVVEPGELVDEVVTKARASREGVRGGTLRASLAEVMVEAGRRRGLVAGRGRAAVGALENAFESSWMWLIVKFEEQGMMPSGWHRGEGETLRVGEVIAGLTDGQRRAVEMRYLRNLPVAEIAERLGRSVASVEGLLRRGRAKVRRELGGEGWAVPPHEVEISDGRRRV